MTPLALGIDTSAYTTSLAIMTNDGLLLRDVRQTLNVPQGQRGLRQSEAVYQHVRNLPNGFAATFQDLLGHSLGAICTSITPRPIADSFMPVFAPGCGAARSIAAVTNAPLWEASHQEGHLWAALWSLPPAAEFKDHSALVVHLSGGTTEALYACDLGMEHKNRPTLSIAGATTDISAGQFIDRVGARLGLPFPCGPHLQAIAVSCKPSIVLPISVRGNKLSFAGPESAAQRAIDQGVAPVDVACAVFICIARSLEKWLVHITSELGVQHVIISGGVAASHLLREQLRASDKLSRLTLWWAEPACSSDNAIGLAAWGACILSQRPLLSLPERGKISSN